MTLHGAGRLCLIILLFLVCQTRASTVEHLSVEQLTERADHIYLATVIGTPQSTNDTDDPSTRLHLSLSRVLKSGTPVESPSGTIEVLLPGGTIDGIRHQIAGMPHFAAGQEIVLFLSKPDASGRRWPIGLAQAKFDVQRQAGRPAQVTRSLDGLHRLEPGGAARRGGGSAVLTDTDDPSSEAMSLVELLGRIQTRLGTRGQQRGRD